ncbi:hypothetical protein FLL45_19615 [Aliikangiella marina]|uniref:SprT-like domain-containing protein n=1 Tax=Aliikangiella marina TaxID=1712262 RepID=A0A545T2C5_9GAMM|nr:SprT-like domain-containing protein [Aliikangiella marina]TQV71366.1 hypothetical protein FLL45_19615 [Aliikangiella marina]
MNSNSINELLAQTKVELLIDSIKARLISEYPFLRNWSVGFDKAKRRAGVCRIHEKRISISLWHIKHNSEAVYTDTILHEFAHAIAYELYQEIGHGPLWKSIAKDIGALPKSVGRFSLPGAPWQLVCCDFINESVERVAPRFRRNSKIKNYYLKGRPETEGNLYFVCSEELALFEERLMEFREISFYQ